MKSVALDIWADLREKRLWPVAVALLVGLVAIPVLLREPAEAPAPATASAPPASAAGADQLLPASLEAAKPLLRTSTLSEFDSKNPFKPLRALKKVEVAAGVESTTSEPAKTDTTGKTGGGTEAPGGTVTPPAKPEEKTVYTYQAVVNLTTASGSRKRTVNRLGILPSDKNPLLVFLGVSADNTGEGVFLVDSTVTQAGEGRCRPSTSTCSFLYLTTEDGRDEHIFTTDDGLEYTVKLLGIRRVPVKESQAPSGGSPSAKAGGRATAEFSAETVEVAGGEASADTVNATLGSEEDTSDERAFEGFGFPLFADEEE